MANRISMWRPPRGKGRIIKKADVQRPNSYQRGYCDRQHFAWRKAVLLRDNWICCDCKVLCADKRQAHADHLIPVAVRPDLRYEVSNGACRCASCHSKRHASVQ